MSEHKPEFGLVEFQTELGAAAAALESFVQGPCTRAGEEVGATFERAAQRITRALGSAAVGGETAFKRMVKVIVEELARLALERIFTQGAPKIPFFGAKAAGGAVNAGGAYLVGERGPEIFVPRQGGQIAPQPGSAVSVHFYLGAGADANSITKHQGQIAASIARAVAYGRRNL